MSKGLHKKPSKRIPAKRRYKIEKKVRDHNRKLSKALKKTTFKKKRKDPGIPSSLPFKEQILNELQEEKKRAEEYRQMIRAQLKQNKLANQAKSKAGNQTVDLAELAKDAQLRSTQFLSNQTQSETSTDEIKGYEKDTSNLKVFYKEFQKVVDASDIIIEVLDARDPLGSRCFEVEDIVFKSNPDKRIILLLNKTDLVPRENLAQWLKYLRNQLPTIPFKAGTQNQKHNLARSKVNIMLSNDELLRSSKCLGADMLLKLLNNYCRNKNIKTSITVGIVGFPNVGKSSVINSLKRSQVCTAGAMPGLTKVMQSITLDKHIKLLDSPGVVFAKSSPDTTKQMSSALALRNAIRIDSLDDPILPIEALLNRVNRQDLMTFYRLTHFDTVKEFLGLVAKRFGKLLKGGILDLNSAAKKVLQDWNCGKIKYYTIPPDDNTSSTISIEIVSKMSQEFDINDFVYQELMNINDDEQPSVEEAFAVRSLAEQTESMMESDQPTTTRSSSTQIELPIAAIQSKSRQTSAVAGSDDVEMEELDGMQLNKNKKLLFKKAKKQRKRDAKLSSKLDDIKLQEDYDFDSFF